VLTRYRAILPDPAANAFDAIKTLVAVLAAKIRALLPPTTIDDVLGDIEAVLDVSIAAEGYVIRERPADGDPAPLAGLIDLSAIDFEALRAHFARGHKHTEAEKLRGAVDAKLTRLVRLNKTRTDYREHFQQLIDEYNAGSLNIETFFARLVAFARSLNVEERRGIAEALTEEELALFDLLTKPEPTLGHREGDAVKKVARDLLATLKREQLALDWRKRQQARARVRLAIEETLDRGLPPIYTPDLFRRKCDAVYQHVFDAYAGAGRSIYSPRL